MCCERAFNLPRSQLRRLVIKDLRVIIRYSAADKASCFEKRRRQRRRQQQQQQLVMPYSAAFRRALHRIAFHFLSATSSSAGLQRLIDYSRLLK